MAYSKDGLIRGNERMKEKERRAVREATERAIEDMEYTHRPVMRIEPVSELDKIRSKSIDMMVVDYPKEPWSVRAWAWIRRLFG